MMARVVSAVAVLMVTAAAASAQVPAGGAFLVNTYTPGQQSRPAAAAGPQGTFVIAWESSGQDGSGSGVFAQRFDAAGQRQGGEFRAHESAAGEQVEAAAAAGTNGDFVVAWEILSSSSFARRFTDTGAPVGAEFGRGGFNPRVATGAGGRSVVVAQAVDSYNSLGVFGSVFTEDGTLVAEFRANEEVAGHQRNADVAALPGGFVVVWENEPATPSPRAIVGQRYDSAGRPLGANFVVSDPVADNGVDPAVAAGGSGQFVIAWANFGGRISARRFGSAGDPLGGQFIVNSFTTSFRNRPSVAADFRGNFVVTWEGYGPNEDTYFRRGIFARRFRADGTPRGEDFHVNTYTTGDQKWPQVASDDTGNFLVTWWDPPADPSQGVSAQRFGGLRPVAVEVDPAGNGVLEAGEVADVRTSWRNVNGGALTFGGALAVLDGLRPATAQVLDGTADYGVVASGAVVPCTDCYRVTVPLPPSSPPMVLRPPIHHDVVLEEKIVPDAHGQDKVWLVHVGGSFRDVPAARPSYRFVETLLHHGVSGGCDAGRFCPEQAVSRAQTAVFALTARDGTGHRPPACTTAPFADVPAGSPFCPFIEELARRGLAGECGEGRFCPDAPVSRGEAAGFLLRTLDPDLDPPACGAPLFADVGASRPDCRWIEELARRGVSSGCGGGNYCPADPVTREQMAVFIAEAFALALYGP